MEIVNRFLHEDMQHQMTDIQKAQLNTREVARRTALILRCTSGCRRQQPASPLDIVSFPRVHANEHAVTDSPAAGSAPLRFQLAAAGAMVHTLLCRWTHRFGRGAGCSPRHKVPDRHQPLCGEELLCCREEPRARCQSMNPDLIPVAASTQPGLSTQG